MASVLINGVVRVLKTNTLDISERVNERSTASFMAVTDSTDNVRITKRQSVLVKHDVTDEVLFAGFVDTIVEKNMGTGNQRFHQITCVDNHYLVDKLIYAGSFENTSVTNIVETISNAKLIGEGITILTENIDGGLDVIVKVQTFNYKRLDTVFDRLAERAGCDWWVDYNRLLYFKKLNNRPVGGTVTEGIIKDGSLKIKSNAHQYRNRQFIKGGRSLTDVRTESQKGDGEKTTFTVGFPIAKKPSISINGVEVDGARIGIKGLDKDDGAFNWFWTSGSTEVTQATGGVKLTSTASFAVTYQGYFSTIIISQDTKEIGDLQNSEGSSGIVEYVDNEPNLDNKEEIFNVANAKLQKYKTPSNSVTFTTLSTDFMAGELVTVDLPSEGIMVDENYLVESVAIRDDYPLIWHTVTVVKGFIHTSWEKAFMTFSNDQTDELINMDAVEVVILPTAYSKTWKHTDAPNPMRITRPQAGLKVGSIDAITMFAMVDRNTHIEIVDALGNVLGDVLATQTVPSETVQITIFVVQQAVAVGKWDKLLVYCMDVLVQVVSDRRDKTNFDEIQIQFTDYKGW